MNPRDNCLEWQHPELPLKLWIHTGTSFGRLGLVQSAIKSTSGIPNYLETLFLIANAYVLDYEWSGAESHPLVEYLKKRNILDVLSTLEMFLWLDQEVTFILLDAFMAAHPKKVEPTTPEEVKDQKKDSSDDGIMNTKNENSVEPMQEVEPIG